MLMVTMDTSPPIPPPKHTAKKADRMPDLSGSSLTPNVFNQYRKDRHGQYWFQLIPAGDRASWRNMISNSIPSYFAAMVNSGQISDDTNKEFQEYTAAVNKFLDEIN
jgi:hypothetical protein